ncbi:MAG: hypothetical protein HKN68_14540 [Saprospiraceae bacterium]|nr:hypothetical protein [Saprospiraceae bacterium]
MSKYKGILRKTGITLAIFLVIVLLLLLSLRTSLVQNFIAAKILSSLSGSLNAEITIDDIKINFFDEATITGLLIKDQQQDTLLFTERLHLDVSVFSFFKKELSIDVATMDNPVINVIQQQEGDHNFSFLFSSENQGETPSTQQESWQIDLNHVHINNLYGSYVTPDQKIIFHEKQLTLDFNTFDIRNNVYSLSDLILSSGSVSQSSTPIKESDPGSGSFIMPDLGLLISVDRISISDHSFSRITPGDTLLISGITLNSSDIKIDQNNLVANINPSAFNTSLGINFSDLNGQITFDSNQLILSDLNIRTERDVMSFNADIKTDDPINALLTDVAAELSASTLKLLKQYIPDNIKLLKGTPASLSANELRLSNDIINVRNLNFSYGKNILLQGNYRINKPGNLNRMHITADVRSLKIDQATLRKLLPSVSIPDSLKRYQYLVASGTIIGPLNQLALSNINLNLDNKISTSLSGKIQNLTNPDNLTYDLKIDQFRTKIQNLPVPKLETMALDSLGTIVYSGNLSGGPSIITINGLFESDLGKVTLNKKLTIADQLENTLYDGSIAFEDFDVGTLLKRDDIGTISLSTTLSGKGFDVNNLDSRLQGKIETVTYNGYTYKNITIDAAFTDCLLDGKLIVDDENISLSYSGIIDLTSQNIIVNFNADIDTINFAALNLFNTQMGMRTNLQTNFELPISPERNGRIAFYDLYMNQGPYNYQDDSVVIDLSRVNEITEIDISSNFLAGHIDGSYRVKELPSAISEIINLYTAAQDSSVIITESSLKSKNIHFKGNLSSLDPINNIISNHEIFLSKGKIDLELDLVEHRIKSNSRLDSLVIDANLFEIIQVRTDQELEFPNLQIEAYDINTVGNISVPYLAIQSTFNENSILADITAEDQDNIPKFDLRTQWLRESSGEMVLTLNDSLNLNNAAWNINEDNRITFRNGVHINNLHIFDDDESMRIRSTDSLGQNMDITFEDFNIRQWITLLASDPVDMSGLMNGEMELRDLSEDFYFLLNLTLSDINYNSKPVGSILLTANDDPTSDIISGTFDLIGSENDIIGTGTFNPNNRELNWDIYMGLLEMRLLDPFMEEIISDSKGIMYGELKVEGTLEKPDIFGEMNFENISTNVDLNNTRYDFDNHQIKFSNKKIDIGSLTLNDDQGNSALVSGIINHNFYNSFQLDLSLNTDKFVFLNTTPRINPIFYGKIILDTDIRLTGPPDLVTVNATARILDKSDLTISPFSQTESILKEDFIRYGKPEDFENQSTRYLQQVARLYPYNVNMNLNVNEDAEFTFIVDPLSGDKLICKGSGDLRVNFKPNGQQEIYGNYQVSEGSYSFSYGDFVNRNFKIVPGGSIRFNGNPLNAVLDVDAVYTAYTSPYELIKNEVSLSDSEINAARRRTNVEVILSLNGSLLSPEIQLNIRIPELQEGNIVAVVDRKLNSLRNNPDELNNQVFALLILNQFISTETSNTGLEKVGQNFALSSISNLISSELNRLAKNVIKGVDVNIDLNSYNSQYLRESGSVNVTEVGLNVSKRLYNDRISISAGGNLNWDDYSLESGSFASFVGDFVFEYRLTESGNYRLRVFSKTDYDRLLNENTSRNGVSIYFNKEFDSKTEKK